MRSRCRHLRSSRAAFGTSAVLRPTLRGTCLCSRLGFVIGTRDETVRLAVYQGYTQDGRPPAVDEMADALGLPSQDVREALRALHDARHLVLGADGEIVMAHPFASAPFGFSVMGKRTLWWGGCA